MVVGLGVVVGVGVTVGLGVGDDVGVAVGVAVGRGVEVGVEVGVGVGLVPDCGAVTAGKAKPKELYFGMLFWFSFIQTVLPIPMLAVCERNSFSSLTVADVKLLYSLKSAPTSVLMSFMPLD